MGFIYTGGLREAARALQVQVGRAFGESDGYFEVFVLYVKAVGGCRLRWSSSSSWLWRVAEWWRAPALWS